VGTFRVAGGQKQGGNVAAYFCTPDGRVLHAVAGPVSATVLLREAQWVVETWKLGVLEHGPAGERLPDFFRAAHLDRFRLEHGARPGWLRLTGGEPADLAALLRRAEFRGLGPQGQVHLLLAAAPLVRIERVYRVVFEDVLGERVSTAPVVVSR
jgi:hypothetical protein